MKAIMQVFQKKRKIITRYIEGDNHIKSDNQFQRGFWLTCRRYYLELDQRIMSSNLKSNVIRNNNFFSN